MWLFELIVLSAVFIGGFFTLIRMSATRFARPSLARVLLGLSIFCLLFLLIDAAFGFLFGFFLGFALLAGGSYYVFLKRSQKVGFIGLCFCLTFSALFFYLQFFLLNFSF